jgi:hypothetical protein
MTRKVVHSAYRGLALGLGVALLVLGALVVLLVWGGPSSVARPVEPPLRPELLDAPFTGVTKGTTAP